MIEQGFIENYHQKLEEDYVFPRLLQVPKYIELIRTLRNQHDAAINLTNQILYLLSVKNIHDFKYIPQLIQLLSLYINMYEPHSAREDTVVFQFFMN